MVGAVVGWHGRAGASSEACLGAWLQSPGGLCLCGCWWLGLREVTRPRDSVCATCFITVALWRPACQSVIANGCDERSTTVSPQDTTAGLGRLPGWRAWLSQGPGAVGPGLDGLCIVPVPHAPRPSPPGRFRSSASWWLAGWSRSGKCRESLSCRRGGGGSGPAAGVRAPGKLGPVFVQLGAAFLIHGCCYVVATSRGKPSVPPLSARYTLCDRITQSDARGIGVRGEVSMIFSFRSQTRSSVAWQHWMK